MQSRRPHNRYAILNLSEDDLPKGDTPAETARILKEGIVQLLDVLRGTPEDIDLPGIRLMRQHALLLNFVLAARTSISRESFLEHFRNVGVKNPNLQLVATQLYQLNSILRDKYGVSITGTNRTPRGVTGRDEDLIRLASDIRQGLTVHHGNLSRIMRPFSITARTDDLPDDVARLQIRALRLIDLIRGEAQNIVLPKEVHLSPSSQILVRATLAKPSLVTWKNLSMALFTPFAEKPPSVNALSSLVRTMRRSLHNAGYEIEPYGMRGLIAGEDCRKKLEQLGSKFNYG